MFGVGHCASLVWFSPKRPSLSAVVGVPQDASPVESPSEVGSADAVCAHNHRPAGVAFRFQP